MTIPRNDVTPRTRTWGEWPARLYERLLEQRIVMAHGRLDNEAATRLCAQLLTLDAENTQPIRLELQSLDAELDAALTVMGVLDALRVPVSAYVAGRLRGPAVGLLALADHRYGYPSTVFVLSEPRMNFDGTVAAVTAQEQQATHMLSELASRLAAVTGRDVEQIRSDFERQRVLTVDEALEYGLIDGRAEPRRPLQTGLRPLQP
ncbi:MAG TPA: ATP-dependent Clp protease proteolytic subunit [Mycobacterium sp.]|nr:ATP-dependent Clp protease proteolytic subunit [Mycobacterium sp.]